MKIILPIVFALILLTGTSGVSYESVFAQTLDNPTPDYQKPEIYKSDRLIVKFKPGVSAEKQSSILSAQNSSVAHELELLKIKIISVPEPALDAVQNALSKNKSVEYAEFVEGAAPTVIPNDTYYDPNDQWYLDKINAEGAWDITKGGDFPIGILDSGIDMDHPDLASKIIHPYDAENLSNPNINDLSNCGHGTGVAGNAAAATDNGVGIAQIGWDTKIIPIKITQDSDPDCLGWSDAVLRGVEHAVSKGAKVVNLSYGFSGASGHIQDAADLLRANNGWLVISAGNSGGFSSKTDYPYIIFVSSTNSNDNLSGFSSYGNYVDISSPGSSILLTTNGGGYGYWGGTSMAAPLAAATLNLLYSVDPSLTSDESFNILKNSAVDLGDPGWDTQFGHGRIDAHAAVLAASNTESLAPEVPPVNFKVAFIGDQGLGTNSEAVLQMIANEGTEMVLHQGDLDYTQNPAAWESMVDLYLGPTFPYFVSVGNHDIEIAGQWSDYQSRLQDRLDSIPDATCVGDLGVKASCHYKGLFFILSGVGTLSTYTENQYVSHIQTELANDDSIWSICSWHKNQQAMQIGGKGNSVGWPAYEACKDGGAIIATAHEHSYERTKTLTNTQTQTVDPTWSDSNDVRVAEGSTFAFVSGLGGKSIRDQSLCDPSDVPYGCNNEWANIYALEQSANHGALFCEFNADGQEDRAYCYFKNISGNIIDSFYVTSFMGTANPTSAPNDAPVANSQAEFTDENNSLIILLSSSDQNGDSLAYSIESTPTNGGLSGTGPYLIYTPDANFDGVDSFTFKTNDGTVDSNIATVTITVSGDPPSTVNSRINSSTDDAEQRISDNGIDLASTDIEIGNDPGHNLDQIEGLRFNNLDVPQGSTITSAYIEFTTDETDSEATSVTIWAQDSDNAGTFTSAASDISNRPTTASSVTWNNILAWNSVGEKHNTPDISVLVQDVVDRSGWNSGNSMAFVISGSGSRTAESWNGDSANAALLHIEWSVTPVNNLPVANNQSVSTDENVPLNITLTASDTDGDPLIFNILSDSTSGVLSGDAPNITYTPNPGYTGSDSFTFNVNDGTDDSNTATVSITVDPVNNPPIAGISNYNTAEDTLLQVPVPGVLGNATDSNGDTLTAVLDVDVANGSLSLNADGSFSYTPDANFNGADSFTYHAYDGIDDSNTATVSITIDAVNDAPTADAGGPYNAILGNSIVFDGSGSFDLDGDSITYFWDFGDGNSSIDANPTHTYGSEGTFPVTLVVNDGNLDSSVSNTSSDISLPNNPPVSNDQTVPLAGSSVVVTLTGYDLDGDSLSFSIVSNPSDGRISKKITTISPTQAEVTYNAKRNFSGSDSFTFLVNDGTDNSNVATITIRESTANSPPVANNDSVSGTEDTDLPITLSANDDDGDSLTYIILSGPSFGVLNGAGPDVTYTPNSGFTGDDSFTFNANDGTGDSNTATVSITINPPTPTITVHVETLVGESTPGKGPWSNVSVDITIYDSAEGVGPGGVIVSGVWSGIISGNDSCTTNSSGTCSVSDRTKSNGDATFTVTGLSGNGFVDDGEIHTNSITVLVP